MSDIEHKLWASLMALLCIAVIVFCYQVATVMK